MLSICLEDHRFHRIVYFKKALIYTIIYYLHCFSLFLAIAEFSLVYVFESRYVYYVELLSYNPVI